uniref:Uncharacterized protein n=1 Tax=Arundo donax TaxID=35708 RepID=A0A0A9DTY2_ARUDO
MASGGISNTKISAEQCWKLLTSGDLTDHLGRKDSVGGLDTFADGTCVRENNGTDDSADVAAPKRCKAPSDEVNNKGAPHGEDNFSENHASPQTAGDAHVCTERSQDVHSISSPVHQYGSSPSEWEHVLKENFFHPGK